MCYMNIPHKIFCALQTGTRASPSTTVPSIKILSLRVCFGVRNDAKMLPSFLRCFPNVERLHLEVTPPHLLSIICVYIVDASTCELKFLLI